MPRTEVPAADTVTSWRGPLVLGSVGSLLLLIGGLGGAAGAVGDPLMSDGPVSWWRYGHGKMLSTLVVYGGYVLLVLGWVRLGRLVLAGRVGTRPVLLAAACWTVPLLFAPALFTRDVYSYLAQGAIALDGYDPFTVGPTVLTDTEFIENVHPFWQGTPAPYGPLFILLAKGIVAVTGTSITLGVLASKVTNLVGLALLLWALPRLVRHLGGNLPVATWLLIAGPLTVVHLVGGPHNDLIMIGFLAAGTALVLDRRPVAGIAVVTAGVAVKASAAVALPFLVWVWAGRLASTGWRAFLRACAGAVAVFVAVFAAVTVAAGVDLGWVTMVNASSRLVNWLSVPTAAGELLHGVVGGWFGLSRDPFVTVTRAVGTVLLVWVLVRQWWLARDGGVDAVRRAAVALFAVAVLSPTMLPWYLTWGLCLAAAWAWKPRQLAVAVGISAFMVAPYTPDGEQLLYVWGLMIAAVALSVLAAVSLVRPDPLRLSERPVR
ncbi:polyprenol phosphomannose-dependent alpha 1,6 mannosyltransferase MptB [Actinophytocola gossypii]|uniref:Polyprenol phosphomannose-dependent alpha 1,6 mannosyltransferase MptB n=1 Tax=Actinophytocola gossypii TaxID=2812003 RepID=A0ABT2J1H1_9PSEU|nr:polyprenol phosphomannose-dependent alpha 1,6 mannosyltransferase MptB [Actinophytocola gossypii]MCT2581708.1 polyprenol phosphomannose-dependent alpha 1,6 mannosyltransferase MptB [Actinophytocola gossypii]